MRWRGHFYIEMTGFSVADLHVSWSFVWSFACLGEGSPLVSCYPAFQWWDVTLQWEVVGGALWREGILTEDHQCVCLHACCVELLGLVFCIWVHARLLKLLLLKSSPASHWTSCCRNWSLVGLVIASPSGTLMPLEKNKLLTPAVHLQKPRLRDTVLLVSVWHECLY